MSSDSFQCQIWLPGIARLRSDLLLVYVEWDVKLYTLLVELNALIGRKSPLTSIRQQMHLLGLRATWISRSSVFRFCLPNLSPHIYVLPTHLYVLFSFFPSLWFCPCFSPLSKIGAVSGNEIIKINLLLHAFPVVTAKERNVIWTNFYRFPPQKRARWAQLSRYYRSMVLTARVNFTKYYYYYYLFNDYCLLFIYYLFIYYLFNIYLLFIISLLFIYLLFTYYLFIICLLFI